MGRPPTWTEAELLGAVMAVFRRKGFGHTSLLDIQEATGLHPGSIYKAYGSKDGIFLAALNAYNERVVARRVATYLDSADRPLSGIRALFASTFESGEAKNPGCLLTTTAVEACLLDPSARAAVSEGLNILEGGFQRALSRAQEGGDIPSSARVDDLAAQMLALYQGVLVLVRFGASPRKLTVITNLAMRSLEQPITPKKKKGKRR